MDNDDLREEEKKSLLDEMSKKGISKIIKTIPLGTKILIISFFIGIISLLVFIVLASSLFIVLGDDYNDNTTSNFAYINNNSEDNYWWPIGGASIEKKDGKEYAVGTPTSTTITSNFSASRTISGVTQPHYGMDIGRGVGQDFVIAVAQGTVYHVGTGCDNNGYYGNTCQGGFGNYIIIEHPGSVYTIYAHLYPNSITVSKGESVNQGQIIGKMGNSGSSTGAHLHFQIEVGGRGAVYAQDPLNYVSATDSRPVTMNSGYSGSNNLLNMIQSFEGTGPTDGDSYLVYKDSGGVLTVGYGVTLVNHADKFSARGIDINNLTVNSPVKKTIVDDIKLEIVDGFSNYVKNTVSNAGITLQEHQIDALTSRAYNTGNIVGFVTAYKEYGNTEALYDNYMKKPVTDVKGNVLTGLKRRRDAEWKLFSTGIYP